MGFIGVQPATVPLSVNDVPDLPATKITSGTFPALNGSNLTNLDASDLTGTLPAISGANLTNVSAGKLLQVVTEKFSTDTEISTTSYSNVFSKSITPTLNTSKVLVVVSGGRWALYGSPSYEAFYSVRRDSSEIMHGLQVIRQVNGNIASGTISVSYLDSPSSSSSISYSLDAKTDNSARAVAVCNAISPITMTLMEIGA